METPRRPPGAETQPGEPPPPDTLPSSGANPPPDSRPQLSARIGRYRVVRRISGGGMGDVYLAEDPNLGGRPVAVKVPHFDGSPAEREQLHERFLREAAAAAHVRHDRVCAVHDFGEHDGRPYLVMDFVGGGSLADRLSGGRRFEDVREAVRLVQQAAEGLAALHAAGVVHRDLKPGNILLDSAGRPLLTDFGLAWKAGSEPLTVPGELLGTPNYMPFEQALDASAAREKADVYSLGAVLYQMLTGRMPFQGNPYEVLGQLATTEPPPAAGLRPDLDAALQGVLGRMMAREPEARPSAPELVETLGEWLEASAAPDRLPFASRSWPAAAVLLTVALAISGVAAWRRAGPDLSPTPARSQGGEVYKGSVNVRVWDPAHPERRRLRLNEPGALPLRAGDRVRVEADVRPAAYLYLVVIDPAGQPQLLYPWKPGQWDSRLAVEEPRVTLSLPAPADEGWPVLPGATGMETLLLLARTEPLTAAEEAQLKAAVTGLGSQKEQTPRSVVWFENGEEVNKDEAARSWGFDAGKIDDPVLRTQALLREKLKPLFPYTRAVSYANRGM